MSCLLLFTTEVEEDGPCAAFGSLMGAGGDVAVRILVADDYFISFGWPVNSRIFFIRSGPRGMWDYLTFRSIFTKRRWKYGLKKMYAVARTPKDVPKTISDAGPTSNFSRDGAPEASMTMNSANIAAVKVM